MLKSLRESVKSPFMKFFLLILVLGFGLWGIGDISTGLLTKSNEAIFTDKNSISTNEVIHEFEKTRNIIAPGISKEEAIQYGLLNDVIGKLARELLFNSEAKRLGIVTTDNMIKTKIINENAFKDENKNFSKQKFIQILSQSGFTEDQYLTKLNSQIKQEQILSSITKPVIYPSNISKLLASFQLEERKARLLEFKSEPEIIEKPSETELISWFEKNKENYRVPTLRSFDLIYLNSDLIKKDVLISEKEIIDGFEIWKEEYSSEETRLLKQMVFDTKEEADKALKDFNNGKDFLTIAKEKLNWTKDDINLGYVSKNDLEENFSEIVFSSNKNELIGPIETGYGINLAMVEDIKYATEANFKNSKNDVIRKLQEEKSIDLLYEYLSMLEDKLGEGSNLFEASKAINKNIISINNIDKNGNYFENNKKTINVEEISTDSLFLEEAWALEIEEISSVIETVNNSFFVIQPKSETQSKLPSFSEVKTEVIKDWKIETSLKKVLSKAEATITKDFKNLKNIIITDKFRRNGSGLDHSDATLIANSIFKQKINEPKIIETGDSAIIIENIGVFKGNEDEINKLADEIQKSLNIALTNDLASSLSIKLSELHNLELKPQNVVNALIPSQPN